MKTIKISKGDIAGSIKNFPIEVVTKMVEHQIAQCGTADIHVFIKNETASSVVGGFDWDSTEEGFDFWNDVISGRKFDKFFKEYPNKFVYIVGDHEYADDVIAELERRGGINEHSLKGDSNDWLYYIDPVTNIIEYCDVSKEYDKKLYEMLITFYNPIENVIVEEEDKIVEVSMEEIAKMMGVDVSNLRIKEK